MSTWRVMETGWALSLGNPETAYAHPKTNHSQSFAISYPYADSYYGGSLQLMGSMLL